MASSSLYCTHLTLAPQNKAPLIKAPMNKNPLTKAHLTQKYWTEKQMRRFLNHSPRIEAQ